jgi:formimidoylglutamate deiminase
MRSARASSSTCMRTSSPRRSRNAWRSTASVRSSFSQGPANLGDGFLPVAKVRELGIPLCIGSDSNVRLDPLEELRELEGIARRQELRRNVVPVSDLLEIGSAEGAKGLGLDAWPGIEVDLGHRSVARVAEDEVEAALVFGCGADVFA